MAWCSRDGVRVHAQTRISPDQVWGLSQVLAMKCAETPPPPPVPQTDPPTLIPDCTGLVYIDLVKSNGTHLSVLGFPPPPGFQIDPTKWSQLPTQ